MFPVAANRLAAMSGRNPPNQPFPMWYGIDSDVYRIASREVFDEERRDRTVDHRHEDDLDPDECDRAAGCSDSR
jgi:hypothetical protein